MPEAVLGRDPQVGPLDLLVIQPTPFCNIDCSYCYLPSRQSTVQMAPEVLDRHVRAGVRWQIGRGCLHGRLACGRAARVACRVLSAGDCEFIADRNVDQSSGEHSFQTNGTLISRNGATSSRRTRCESG